MIDDVLSALSRQNISISLKEYAYSLLLYKSEDRQNAIPLVVKLRDAGVRTELVSVAEGKALEEYLAFGKNQGAEGILYLDGENVTVYDMASGDQETKTLQEFRRNIKMRYLTFALAKGRLANKTMDMFEKLGITCDSIRDKETRKLIFVNEDLKLKFFLAKASDVPTYVEYGAADIGIVGEDTILEEEETFTK